MSPRAWIETAGTVALALAVLWGLHLMQGRAEARGEARVWEERADSLRDHAAELRRAQEAHDLQARVALDSLAAERDSAEARAARAASQRPRAAVRVVEVAVATGADSVAVQAAVDSLEAVHASEVGALRSLVAVQDSVIRTQAAQLAFRDERIRVLEEGLAAATAEGDAWRRAVGGGWFSGALGDVLKVGGGLAAGWVLKDAVGG